MPGGCISQLLKRSETADLMHVSVSTVRRIARAGLITEVRVSKGAVRIDAESVDAFIRARSSGGAG
jgi:excisionase family DNA binding protein